MMQEDRYNDFDLQIRSMLQDAEEEVPSRVWDAVSGRIGRGKVIGLWWRRAAAGVAVAAAVALGVFFAADRQGASPADTPAVAEAETVPVQIVEGTGASEEVLVAEAAAGRRAFTGKSGVRETVLSEPAAEEAVIPETDSAAKVPDDGTESVSDSVVSSEDGSRAEEEEYRDDPFARMAYEDAHKRSRKESLSGFVQGNVTSNERSGRSSGHMASASSGVPKKTGVNDEKSISTYGIPLSFGVGVKYRFAPKWSVSAALDYSLLTRSFTGTYNEVTGGKVTRSVTADVTNNLHYIGIPVNIYYDVLESNKVSFYAFGGVSVEKGIVNKFRIDGQPVIHHSESVSGVQLSSALGLGLEFMLNDYLALYIDPSARYYFDCKQPNNVRTQKQFMMNLEVGLRFDI